VTTESIVEVRKTFKRYEKRNNWWWRNNLNFKNREGFVRDVQAVV
jgi:hypothetical protein